MATAAAVSSSQQSSAPSSAEARRRRPRQQQHHHHHHRSSAGRAYVPVRTLLAALLVGLALQPSRLLSPNVVVTAFAAPSNAGAGGAGGGGGLWSSLARSARRQATRMTAVKDALLSSPSHPQRAMQQGLLVDTLLEKGPVPVAERDFLINGWRWHSRAVLRDVGRFKAVARQEKQQQGGDASGPSRLPACYDFLWGFSWTALLKIEGELFYPFLRRTLPKDMRPLLDELEASRRSIADLGAALGKVCEALRGEAQQPAAVAAAERVGRLDRALALAEQMEAQARELVERQEAAVVPVVAAYVTSKDQKRFNNKVISNLGIFNSRVHLVSMAEAVRGDAREEPKFRQQIPGIAQAFIPRWREKLYGPMAKCLEL